MPIDIYNCDNKYGLIYTDPPWPQQKGGLRKSRPNQRRSLDYPTMTLSDIQNLHQFVGDNLADEKFNIFMWTIDKFLPDTERMMRELGYELHARMIWDKGNGVAPAFTVRYSHEYLLWFYKKGHLLQPCKSARGKYTTVFREASTIHSQKPLFVYEMLEDMFPYATKLELFARQQRRGWDCFGNEC